MKNENLRMDGIYRQHKPVDTMTPKTQAKRLTPAWKFVSRNFGDGILHFLTRLERSLSPCRTVRQQDNFINNYSYERKA
jgi:hypothetical protein